MERRKLISLAIAFLAMSLMMAGCKSASVEPKQMAGTMEEPMASDMMPDSVQ